MQYSQRIYRRILGSIFLAATVFVGFTPTEASAQGFWDRIRSIFSRDCRINVSDNQIQNLLRNHVPRNVSGSAPSVAIYLSDRNGQIKDIIFEQHATRPQAVASVQKLLTAYTAYIYGVRSRNVGLRTKIPFLESYMRFDEQGGRARNDRNQIITRQMAARGEKVTLARLVHNLLYFSSNGSASAIAEAVGGSQTQFNAMMNYLAHWILIQQGAPYQSYFQNPHGLTDTSAVYKHGNPNRRQLSTANNMAVMLAHMMADSGFASFLNSSAIVGANQGHFDKKGVTRAAGTTVVRSVGLSGRGCSNHRVVTAIFGRPFVGTQRPNQSDDFERFHAHLTSLM